MILTIVQIAATIAGFYVLAFGVLIGVSAFVLAQTQDLNENHEVQR